MIPIWENAIPNDVVNSFQNAVPPVIFLGSGFGKEALPPLMTAGELALAMRNELAIDDGGEGLAELLQYYKNSMSGNRQAVVNWLARQLHDGKSKPGGAHRLLLHLSCKEFVTTNYDSLLIDAAHEIPGYKLIPIDDPASYKKMRPQVHNDERAILGRLHGAFESQTRMVATTDDYIDNYVHDEQWHEIVRDILANNRVVFIGYSLRDFTMWTSYISMFVRWGGNQYQHVMVGPSSSHHVIDFWNKYGIKNVPLRAGEFLVGLHSKLGALENDDELLFAAAAMCMGTTYDDALRELEALKERRRYPDLRLTATKTVLEKADAV